MDELVKVALVGTAQRASGEIISGAPVDALIARGQYGSDERKLLLHAGALAIYRMAGTQPLHGIVAPEPASSEELPACSPGAAQLIAGLLKGVHSELLPEALERLRVARLRLPFDVLPLALSMREHHHALAQVVGARGRWLSDFNPHWAWLRGVDSEQVRMLPDNAEATWQEGTQTERVAVLRQVRGIDPARAREWLAAVWKREKADLRAELLDALRVDLALADEALLEAALDDRAAAVRARAALLLALLSDSALSRRMAARADRVLSYAGGALSVTDPTVTDAAAVRDGLVQLAGDRCERELRIAQYLTRVPLAHWNERFGTTPDELVASARELDIASYLPVLVGWTRAFSLHGGASWALPLWHAWIEPRNASIARDSYQFDEMVRTLMPHVPTVELERIARELIAERRDDIPVTLNTVLSALPHPWSVDISAAYLSQLRQFVGTLTPKTTDFAPWDDTLEYAALGLPPQCFASALEPFALPERSAWYLREFVRKLDIFTEAIRLRQRLIEEIPL